MDARAVRGRGCDAANSYPPPPQVGTPRRNPERREGDPASGTRPMRWRGVAGGADERLSLVQQGRRGRAAGSWGGRSGESAPQKGGRWMEEVEAACVAARKWFDGVARPGAGRDAESRATEPLICRNEVKKWRKRKMDNRRWGGACSIPPSRSTATTRPGHQPGR
jgi:hypothetical protein